MMNIDVILNNVLSENTQYRYVPEFNPENSNIRALTLTGESIKDKKTKFFAYYGVPEHTCEKLPAVILIHGGGGHAYHCWVKQWNERGYAAIAIDTTGFMPKTVNAGYKEGDDANWSRALDGVFSENGYVCSPNNDEMKISGKSIDEHWMLHAVSAAIRANNFLRQQEEIDLENIGVVGVSWGGVIVSILIGFDKRLRFAVPIYGSGYLKDSLSDIMQVFKDSEVCRYWLAEKRFDNVRIPVLWLAWNDDYAFSVQSNTKSYNHTKQNNSWTRLSLVNLMYHSHLSAWQREEPFYFADWIVKKGSMFPDVSEVIKEEEVTLYIAVSPDISIENVNLYYICEPMQYEVKTKYGIAQKSFMASEWKTKTLKLENNIAFGKIPTDAIGYYHEVIFVFKGKKMTVTTGYREKH